VRASHGGLRPPTTQSHDVGEAHTRHERLAGQISREGKIFAMIVPARLC
jgi:hypothetical protein